MYICIYTHQLQHITSNPSILSNKSHTQSTRRLICVVEHGDEIVPTILFNVESSPIGKWVMETRGKRSSHRPGSLVSDGTFPKGDQRRMELQKLTVENMGTILHLRGANGNLASFTEKPYFQHSGKLASASCKFWLIVDEVCVGRDSEVWSSSQLETRETRRKEYAWAVGTLILRKEHW